MCGYFARSREKFLRALAGGQFGYALGWRPLSAHFCIALASRCSRICGRAFNSVFLRQNSSSALIAADLGSRFLQQRWQFRVSDRMTNPSRTAKMLLHEEDLKVAELCSSGAAEDPEGNFDSTESLDIVPTPRVR